MKNNSRQQRDKANRPSPAMGPSFAALNRRGFLKTTLQAGVAMATAPMVVRGAVLGRDGGVSPSEQIIMGGIGIGNRGRYVLSCFLPNPDVQFIAVCDVQQKRRESIKKMVDDHYGNRDCGMTQDFRE